jgi:hypothetical protein
LLRGQTVATYHQPPDILSELVDLDWWPAEYGLEDLPNVHRYSGLTDAELLALNQQSDVLRSSKSRNSDAECSAE